MRKRLKLLASEWLAMIDPNDEATRTDPHRYPRMEVYRQCAKELLSVLADFPKEKKK